jgi:TonB family protein
MEAFALYLLKSVIWLIGFELVYLIFLKNERFFELNRIFLISGILAALIFPFLTISYKVILPVMAQAQSESAVAVTVKSSAINISGPDFRLILFYLYLTGLLFVVFMIIKQGSTLLKVISKAGIELSYPVKLVRTAEYESAFSFFSYVFVNPSVTEIEIKEIMNHEMVHIRQKHWFDLMLVQLLCALQWFNPVIWIYIRSIRQNHEYLADKVALQRTSDPAIYRAALLNQIVGSQVISLVNSFNYSINRKRFTMMKNNISSPYRKMKILFILPVFAIVFYAFARPDYRYVGGSDNPESKYLISQTSANKVSGSILEQNGTPLPGASVIVMGTTTGTTSDTKGYFSIQNVPDDGAIVVTFVGYKSKVIKADFIKAMRIEMARDTISYLSSSMVVPPPPPPPPTVKIRNTNGGPPPLIVLDGVITNIEINTIEPDKIQSISVIKDKSATDKYGDKGKNGVIEITSKKVADAKVAGSLTDQKSDKEPFVIIEELPEFTGGGRDAMRNWINKNLSYPGEAYNKKITGKVVVGFIVSKTGKIQNVQVINSVHPLLDAEAIRIITGMPDWKPGSQNGKTVNVQMKVAVEFKL